MDEFERIQKDLERLGKRVEQLRDPSTLAYAQAELERQVGLLEGHLVRMSQEIAEMPRKFEEALDRVLKARA